MGRVVRLEDLRPSLRRRFPAQDQAVRIAAVRRFTRANQTMQRAFVPTERGRGYRDGRAMVVLDRLVGMLGFVWRRDTVENERMPGAGELRRIEFGEGDLRDGQLRIVDRLGHVVALDALRQRPSTVQEEAMPSTRQWNVSRSQQGDAGLFTRLLGQW